MSSTTGFRFSLRWLLIAVAVAAVACTGWPIVRQAMVTDKLQSAGATVQFADDEIIWTESPPKSFLDHLDGEITEVVWDDRLQGGKVQLIGDDELKQICSIPTVWNITLDDCGISDEALVDLRLLPRLSVFRLRKSGVGDAGVKHIVNCKNLKNLILANSKVSDQSAAEFGRCTKLYYLDLSNTTISDKTIDELQKMTTLTYVNISGTQVTNQGAARLREALPDCKVNH